MPAPNIENLSLQDRERIQRMVGIWFQVSAKHRTVARFPKGKTGMEALREAGGQRCDDERWIRNLGELSCGDHFLRVYSTYDRTLQLELTVDEWAYYKQVGGGTYPMTGPVKEADDPTWVVQVWKRGPDGRVLAYFDIAKVKTKHPDAAVAAIFNEKWKPEDAYDKAAGGVFRYTCPDSEWLLSVSEVEP